jgi:5-methyltetrahydrofolate--homocysteine methyltransferase
MASSPILDLIARRPVLFDGAFGTELMTRGLPSGHCPELWNVEKPDAVRDIHRSYFEAGSDAAAAFSSAQRSARP